jgi:hypothetical protein
MAPGAWKARVDVDVGFGDRVGLVGQVVEEPRDVPAFPAVGEVDRYVGVGVEVEVPGAFGDLALLVVVRAGQGGFHGGEADDVVAVAQGVAERQHRAEVVPDHGDRSLDVEVAVNEGVQVRGHRPLVVAVAGLGRRAGAAVVGGDDAVAGLRERGEDLAPGVPGLRGAVDEHHRLRLLPFGRGGGLGEGVADAD